MNIPKSKRLLKKQAENILSEKLCRCIKKVGEPKSLAICTESVFKRKNLKRGRFSCRGKQSVKISKDTGTKTRKNRK